MTKLKKGDYIQKLKDAAPGSVDRIKWVNFIEAGPADLYKRGEVALILRVVNKNVLKIKTATNQYAMTVYKKNWRRLDLRTSADRSLLASWKLLADVKT